jgi:hypothetical protein
MKVWVFVVDMSCNYCNAQLKKVERLIENTVSLANLASNLLLVKPPLFTSDHSL